MPTAAYVVMPDAVILARGVLLASTALTTVVGERVVTSSPPDVSTPWVRLHQIGGARSASAPMHLATRSLQVDAFVPPTAPNSGLYSGDSGAMALALLAEAALFDAAGYSTSVGTIAYVTETQGPFSLPDTSRTPPTPRVLFTLAITLRPT